MPSIVNAAPARLLYNPRGGHCMGKGRLEAFSDGVIAIIITIMVLELRTPHGADLHALRPLVPVLLSYVLSFLYVGIYWNNHHHMLHATHVGCVEHVVMVVPVDADVQEAEHVTEQHGDKRAQRVEVGAVRSP